MTDLFLDTKKQKNNLPLSEICCSFLQKCKFYLVLALLVMGVGNVWGQYTGIYTFGSAGNVSSFNYNGTAISNLTVSAITKNGVTSSSSSGNYRASNWTIGSTNGGAAGGTLDATDYFEFTITAASGYTISNPNLNFGVGRSGTGPRRFQWRWSVDNYGSALNVGTVNSSITHSSGVLETPDANTGYTGNAISTTTSGQTAITFRFYAYGAEGTFGTGGLQGVLTFGGTLVASTTAPTAPIITTITPGNGQLSVAFTAPSSNGGAAITNYAYSTNNGSTYTTLSTPSTTSPIVISGLTNNTTYDVKIRAINSVGSGAESNMVQGTPTNAATVPILTTPTVSNITTTSATLGATITSDGGSSISSRGTVFANTATPRGNLATEGGTAVGAFSHVRSGLTPNTFYYFAGFASNTPGTAYSGDGTFTTLHNAPTVGSGSGATTSAITANWTAPTGGGSAGFTYEVEISISNTFASTLSTQANIASNTTQYTFAGLTEGTTYYFRVRAVNAGGNSAWSAISAPYATLNNAILLTALGTAATEDFNTLASSGTSSTMPIGWYLSESRKSANSTYTAGTGSSNSGDTYSFGLASNSDRALGGLQSGSVEPTIGAKVTNNTGSTINNLFISYTGETWRVGAANRSDQLDFQYSINATSLTTGTWTDFNGLDYANPGQATGSGSIQHSANISDVITGLNIANGASFWIRWTDFNASGSDDGMAIDDISIKPCGTVAAPTATAAQSFCSGATIADLTATGTAIQWYAASSGGAPLSSSTALADNTTYYASQTISGCESLSRTAVAVTFKATHTWVGGSTGNWNTAANWCGGVPNSTSASVTIPSGTTVTLNTNASVAQLTIASGATLTVSGASQLTVASGGTFTNNGTFTAGTGTLIFAGSGTLAGSATTLHHLTLNGALTRSATTTVNGTLTMNTSASLSAALQFGSTSTLVYNVSGSFTVSDNEWPVSNGPNHVTIQNNALVSLNGNKAINGTLTLTSGKIILGNHSLIANAFSGGSSSAYVITDGSGRLQTNVTSSPVVFPVGPDASNYNPVTITNNTGTADDFAVLVFEEITEEGTRNGTRRAAPNRVNLTWDIDKLTSSSANAGDGVDFAFSWKNSQLKGSIQSSRFRLYHHDGSSWDPQMGTPSVSQNSSISTLVYTEYKGSFSPFAIGDDVQLLPVLWGNTSLKYLVDKKSALLEWSTLFEENTAKFEVERSENGMDWYKIYATKAAGQSFTILEYSFEDMAPVVGNSFYRVKQIDIDGLFAYSNSLPLFIDQTSSTHSPYVFPIPASSILFIRYDGHTQINCSLLNSFGAEVINSQTVYMNDNNLFDLDVIGIVSGSYLLKIETKYGVDFVKVIID